MEKFQKTVEEIDINTGKTYKNTYNSYVIRGEKTALINGATENIADKVIKNASYAIFNHAFPAPGIDRILGLNPGIEIIATTAAIKNLKEMTNRVFNERIAKDGAVLDLGGRTLEFLITPSLNWPDTMMTYDKTHRLLFSGMALGSYENGNLREFYDTQLARFKPFVKTAAERIKTLDIRVILPDIGSPIESGISEAIDDYIIWSDTVKADKKTAAIFYVSSTGNTESMAQTVKEVMLENSIDVKCFNASYSDSEEVLDALYGADMLSLGSPTVHRGAPKPIWDIISSVDLVNMKYKPCMLFGSYGWGGEGIQYLYNHLKLLRLKPFEKPFGCLFTPSGADIAELKKYTKRFLESLNEI